MRAINHALTGATIGLVLPAPIALPAAFLSHFVLDAIPHFGSENTGTSSRAFNYILAADALLCIGLVVILAVNQPAHWIVASISAFLATSPDLMWIGKYLQAQRGKAVVASKHWLLRFHTWIQWFEQPAGLVTEIVWFAGLSWLIGSML